jgi:hypothetical protein
VAKRINEGDMLVERLGSEMMFANVLTKSIKGAQFERKRRGLTNKD